MSQNLTDFSLTFLAWRGFRPTPLPFANDNFADIDLSTAEIDNLITALQSAKAHHEQVTIRLSNKENNHDQNLL